MVVTKLADFPPQKLAQQVGRVLDVLLVLAFLAHIEQEHGDALHSSVTVPYAWRGLLHPVPKALEVNSAHVATNLLRPDVPELKKHSPRSSGPQQTPPAAPVPKNVEHPEVAQKLAELIPLLALNQVIRVLHDLSQVRLAPHVHELLSVDKPWHNSTSSPDRLTLSVDASKVVS
eukprot:CAMPEP_0182462402 /NCGR_PEP_ID=MMETSP1319-20130603/6678_1 /TAXON_ID=172717 /ORGANISM="Bolidomonas pacifica, Strain RCC208" /LENGTH=173 /DNA_ID=CAMNT_0024661829 /DNA_START=917 /DNA_END=1438 /DNA_ORIENTATION=-